MVLKRIPKTAAVQQPIKTGTGKARSPEGCLKERAHQKSCVSSKLSDLLAWSCSEYTLTFLLIFIGSSDITSLTLDIHNLCLCFFLICVARALSGYQLKKKRAIFWFIDLLYLPNFCFIDFCYCLCYFLFFCLLWVYIAHFFLFY